jgi:RHS repeat-associated protein
LKFIKFVSVFVGLSLLVQSVTPANASTVAPSYAAEDYIAARLQAAVTNHRILVISEMSELSTTWVNPDGTLTTESFGAPVRVRDGAGEYGWRDLDFTLVFDDAGFVRAKSGRFDFKVSGGGTVAAVASNGLVSISGSDGNHFGFGWDGALPKPVLFEDTARFDDVLPNVDLLIRLDASGFEQSFEVKAKPDAATLDKLKLLVKGKNVRLQAASNGGYEFVSGSQVLGSVPTPYMYDSADGATAPITSELEPVIGSTGVLDLAVDGSFFEREDLEYPVIVDPAVVLDPTFDTYVTNVYPTTDFQSSTELLVGTPDGGSSIYRSYLNFDSTGWINQDIIKAELKLYLNWSWSCTARNFSIYAISPATPSTRWANAPELDKPGSTGVAKSVAAGYNSSCPAANITTDVTNLAANMPVVISNRAGFGIKASNESDSFGWKRFNSSNASNNKPSLTINYNRYPGTAVTPTVSDSIQNSGYLSVGSWKPTFTSKAVDPDGGNVTLAFKSYPTATSPTASSTLCTVTVSSGSSGSCKPTTALTNNQTYFVKALSSDSKVSAVSASPLLTFKVEATQPLTPTITCPYANGYQGGYTPTATLTCTVSSVAAPESYRTNTVSISVDGAAPVNYQTNFDGSLSQIVSLPAGSFQRRITAVAKKTNGISSATSSHTMTFGFVGAISPLNAPTVASNVVVSGYAASMSGLLPSMASIEWRKQGTSTAWEVAQSNLPLTTKSGLKGVYNHKLNVSNIGVFGAATLPHNVPVTIDLRFCFYYSSIGEWFCSEDSGFSVTRLPNSLDNAVASAGPGIVSLVSGKFNMSTTDYSQQVGLQSLSVSRTYTGNSFYTDTQSSVFGEGWSASFSSDATALSGYSVASDPDNGHYYLVSPDFDVLEFASSSTSALAPVSEEAKAANLQVTVSGNVLTVVETDQATTTFTKPASGDWRLLCAKSNASSRAVITTFDTTGRVSASGYAALGTVGCQGSTVTQGLVYSYNASGLLATVSYRYLDATGLPVTVLKKSYAYESGVLVKVTDNTNSSIVSYEYNGLGKLSKVSVKGFAPYTFKYDASGRLVQVARSLNSSWVASSSVEQTFVYDLKPSGNAGLLPNLPVSTTSLWGQETAPFYAAAVFGADSTISLDASGNVIEPAATSTLWRNADFTFLDVTGKPTNTASYGKTKWLYTATIRDKDDVVYATFDSQGINNVLDRTTIEGNSIFDEFMYANVSKFYTQVNGVNVPNGAYVSDSWSPIRTISDAAGVESTVRTHTSFIYDEGQQSGVLTGLLTSSRVGLVSGTALSTTSQLLGRTVNEYAPQDGSTVSGWTLGTPTLAKTYDSSDQPVFVSKVAFNQLGQPVKTVAHGSDGLDARTDVTVYYSSAANSLFPECGLKPAWQDLLCISQTGEALPSSKSFVSAYDSELNPLTVAEYRFGSLVRTTTNTYLADGRADTSTVSATGTASIATKHLYDQASLLETRTENYVAGVKQSETSQSFDAWGRQITSTNSLGEVTSTNFVPSGQLAAGAVSTVVSPKTTTSYTYGNTAEPRALVTGMTVTGSSSAGTPFSYAYSGVYDEYGRLTSQSGPNGVTQTYLFNDAGQISSMSYGSVASTVLSWSREYDGYGRVVRELAPDSATSASPKTTVYGYDSSSRLASVSSNGASCFTESYSYNSRGDRTSSSVGVCGATTTKTNTFNAESQLTTSGYVYDALGRNTFIPAVDAPANNAGISLSYNLVDQVTGITQNGSTTSFTYDALGRRVNETAGGLTTVRHYSDSSDNPEWTTQQSGANLTTEIYTGSLGAGLAVTTTFKGTVRTSSMQLTDIRGHTVTTLDLDSNSVAGWSVYDSFGNPQTSQTNTNLINYSSYGQQERATNTTGLILMGARVYNPETNQFTSKDPIKGGNENSYTYPSDPLSRSDCTGLDQALNDSLLYMAIAGGLLMCPETLGLGCLEAVAAVTAAGVLGGVNDAFESEDKSWQNMLGGGIKAGLQSYVNSKTFDKWLGKSVDVSLKQISKLPIIKKLKIKEQKFALEFMKEALISKASDTATEPFWTSVWGTKPNVPKTSVNKLDLRCRPSK